MRSQLFHLVGPIVLYLFVAFGLKAQSPCYQVMLGATPGEQVRVHGPSFDFHTNSEEGLRWQVSGLTSSPTSLANAKEIEIEIKLPESRKFRPVKLKIPNQEGCHLLLVRDLKLRSPMYFRAEWITQAMMDEYFFPPRYNGFDTTLFMREYKTENSVPVLNILYMGELLTPELIRSINPFNGQNIELDLKIYKTDNTPYTVQLKAVEISFIHPDLVDLEPKHITASSFAKFPQDDSRFYWPNDFSMIPGAKIIFKCLFWYKDGYEIIESGMVTQTIEF